jgi:hypothetical protein
MIGNPVKFLLLFEIVLLLVRLDHVAGVIVNVSLRGCGHASGAPMHYEPIWQKHESMAATSAA